MMRPFRVLAALVVCGFLATATASARADITIGFGEVPGDQGIALVDQYAGLGVEFGHPHRWGIDLGTDAGCGYTSGDGSATVTAGGINGNSLAVSCTGRPPGGPDQPADLGYSMAWRFPVKRRYVSFNIRTTLPPFGVNGSGPFVVNIRALNSNLSVVDTRAYTLAIGGLTSVTFNHGVTQDIAYVVITGTGTLLLDDLFALTDAMPPPPEYALALTTANLDLTEGDSGSVPVKVVRFGGSTGTISVHVDSLPAGIVSVSADPLGGTAATTLRVSADSPATGDRQVTVSADPNGVAGTLVSGPLSLSVHLQTALYMDRQTLGATSGCGGHYGNIGFIVRGGYTGAVGVSITKLSGPATLAGYLPTVMAAGTGSVVMLIGASSTVETDAPTTFNVQLSPVGATPVNGALAVYSSAAESVQFSGVDRTAIYHALGSGEQHQQLIARGNFPDSCPVHFTDDFGSTLTQIGTTVPQDPGQSPGVRLDLGTDPVSTSIHAVGADGKEYAVSTRIAVSEFRNTFATRQVNGGPGAGISGLNWDDFERAFGKDDSETCYADYCVRDPTAVAYYNKFVGFLQSYGGLCFGWSSQAVAFASQTELPSEFLVGALSGYSITNFGDDTAIKRNVAIWQMRYNNRDMLIEVQKQVSNPLTIAQIRERVTDGARDGKPKLIAIWNGAYGVKGTAGHAVVAYDVRSSPKDNGIDLITYNPNYPYASGEETTKATRDSNLASSRIHITPGGTWSGGIPGWSGALNQLEVLDLPPINAALPVNLPAVSVGSAKDPSSIGQITIGGRDALRASGSVIRGRGVADASPPTGRVAVPTYRLIGSRPAQLQLVGRTAGVYSGSLLGGSVAASLSGATTTKGQRDLLTVTPNKAEVAFTSAAAATRATLQLDVKLSRVSAAAAGKKPVRPTRSVSVSLAAGGGRSDVIALEGGARTLEVRHHGPATTVAVTLEDVGEGLPSSANLAPLPLGRDEQLSIKPGSWGDLGAGATYQVRHGGRLVRSGRAVVLAQKVVRLAQTLKLTTKLGAGSSGSVTVAGRVLRRGGAPNLIVTVRVTKGGRTIATASAYRRGGSKVRRGRFAIPVKLKQLPRGGRLAVTVTLLDEGARLASAQVRRVGTVR